MAHCFSLTRIGEDTPTKLQTIDDMMREHFSAAADPNNWFNNWYTPVGFALATGQTFAEIRKAYESYVAEANDPHDVKMLEIIGWLESNFTPQAWRESGFANR